MGLFEAIRRDRQREDLSVRALARRYGVHRRTVRQALASPAPPPRKRRSQLAPKLDPVKPLIDAMLREDLTAPGKQRHTARRVLARLLDEHDVHTITYSTVRDYVRVCRVEINAEAGRCVQEAFVPQTHEPAAEAEVDFADLWIDLKGIRTKVFLFTLRLSFSGRAVHRVFASQGQEAFLEGHVCAFERLGGTPIDKIRYDNLKSAVSRVLFGRNRVESERWVLFRSWYLLTELTSGFAQVMGGEWEGSVTVPAHDRQRGPGAGSGDVGRPAGRVAGVHRRSVAAVSGA